MKWWPLETVDIPTPLPAIEVMNRIRTIARPRHGIIDTLNPDHVFTDDYKLYVGTINDRDFRVKRSYYTYGSRGRSQTIGLVVTGQVEDNLKNSVLHLRFTIPAINLLWFLFPPLWMLVIGAYAGDASMFHGIPVLTCVALLLVFYLYWMVLAQFRRKARNAAADFQQALNAAGSNNWFNFTGFTTR